MPRAPSEACGGQRVATNYLNELVPSLGDAVNWLGAGAMLSAGDPLSMLITGGMTFFNAQSIAYAKTLEADHPTGLRPEVRPCPGGGQVVPGHPGE